MSNGRIILDNSVDQETLHAYAANPEAVLDVTGLDLGRLPVDVKASLYSQADAFNAPHLRISGDIDAHRATSFRAPQLRKAENISATHAKAFEVPRLLAAGNIFATSAATFAAPELRIAGDIDAFAATNCDLPVLHISGYIHARFAARATSMRPARKPSPLPCLIPRPTSSPRTPASIRPSTRFYRDVLT